MNNVRAEGRWELLKLWLERQRVMRDQCVEPFAVGHDVALEQTQIKMRDIERFIPDTGEALDTPDTHRVCRPVEGSHYIPPTPAVSCVCGEISRAPKAACNDEPPPNLDLGWLR